VDNYNKDSDKQISLPKKWVDEKCKDTIVFSLYELFNSIWEGNGKIRPVTFKKIIGTINDTFSGVDQNDSQELLNLILDKIHEDVKYEVAVKFNKLPGCLIEYMNCSSQYTQFINDPSKTEIQKTNITSEFKNYMKTNRDGKIMFDAYTYWVGYIKNSYSIITELFTGLFCSQITCSVCHTSSYSFEPFTMLSLETKDTGEESLNDCLENFSREELLSGENQYSCDTCKTKENAIKKIYIWELPAILIVQLKRFKHTGTAMASVASKTHSKVIFPIDTLNIQNSVIDLNKNKYTNTNYELYSVCEHRGTCDFGHYVAYCRNKINNEWYEFDDDDIYHIPRDKLEHEIINKNAYILFYVKKTIGQK
jgi:ubiquitin C-terminal hydrolase